MSWIFGRREADLSAMIPPNSARVRHSSGSQSPSALRASAAWAAVRLRADLLSTMPLHCYRDIGGVAAQCASPEVMVHPGSGLLMHEWLYSSQVELDRFGNAFGQIVARDALGRPSQIELSSSSEWQVVVSRATGAVEYRRLGRVVPTAEVWHERQFTLPGVPVGLSPTANAAWSLDHNLSAQQFALDWFDAEALPPVGTLQNTRVGIVDRADAAVVKEKFKQSTRNRDLFVTGKDWVYTPGAAVASDAKFLDAIEATNLDLARFYGVPADLIDVAAPSGSITYANISQRNLQFLIMHLGPAISRRERVLSDRLLPSPRYAKFNTAALLRMDEAAKVEMLAAGVAGRIITADEARNKLDRMPLSEQDYAQFDRLFGSKNPAPGTKQGVSNE